MTNTEFQIGQAVVSGDMMNGEITGYVAEIHPREHSGFAITGNGLQAVGCDLVIAFENFTWAKTADRIAEDWRKKAADYMVRDEAPAYATSLLKRAKVKVAQDQDERRRAREAAEQAESDWRDGIRDKVPADAQAVIIAEYELNNCDSQTDYFNTKTVKTVILAFSNKTREDFKEMRKAALNYAATEELATAPKNAEHREKYSMGKGYYLKDGNCYSTGWEIKKRPITGTSNDPADYIPYGEWAVPDPAEQKAEKETTGAAVDTEAGNYSISEHTHTKKSFQMWIVSPSDRSERAIYDERLAQARSLGGWWSRAYRGTPAGFAFKDQGKAKEFAAMVWGEAVAAPAPSAPKQSPNIAGKLEAIADKLQGDIDAKFADRAQNTPKQRKQAVVAWQDGNNMQRAQKALRALAELHRAGTVPSELAKLNSKKAALELAREKLDHSNAGYYDAGRPTGEPAEATDAARAFWNLAGGKSPEEKARDEITALEMKIKNSTIPGFFPTPSALVAQMVERAALAPGLSVLEPSAGSGALAQGVAEAEPRAALTCLEINASLATLLKLKGFDPQQTDFMEFRKFGQFDRVIMNPPFEQGQDVEHVRRAFEHLKPGGVLVAIMSPAWQFNTRSKFANFRDWISALPHHVEEIGAGAFKEAGTNVSTVMVTISRPERDERRTLH